MNYLTKSPLELFGRAALIYDYLKENVISCPQNNEQLEERVRELYYDYLSETTERSIKENITNGTSLARIIIPSSDELAGIINDENIDAIYIFCAESSLSVEEADDVIALYSHDIGCILDDEVHLIMFKLGLSSSHRESIIFQSQYMMENPCDSAQIMFDWRW